MARGQERGRAMYSMERTTGAWSGMLGRWEEQAWVVRLLAAEAGVRLDQEDVLLYDVRDLLALRRNLDRRLSAASRPPWERRSGARLKRLWLAVTR
ncbi:MAG: hypothetical protein NVSMB65_14400 [Chloroflexota bacterium]